MTLHVAAFAAVLLLFVSICPTVTTSRKERSLLATLYRCVARLFHRHTVQQPPLA